MGRAEPDAPIGSDDSAAREEARPHGPDSLTVLVTVAAVFGRLEPAGVVEALLKTALTWSGASRALLMTIDEHGLRIEGEGTSTEQGAALIQCPPAPAPDDALTALAHRVVRAHEVVHIEDGQERMGLPLLDRGQPGGALCLEAGNAERFSPQAVVLLKGLATAAGTALGNARRYARMRDKAARTTALYDSNVMGVFYWDLTGRVAQANDAFLKIVGYSRDDLAHGLINWAAMTPPEYRWRDELAMVELMTAKHAAPFEKVYVRKDGVPVPLMLTVSRFADDPNEGVCVAIDISELKAAEARLAKALAALQESRSRLGTALKAGRMGIWRQNLSDGVLDPSAEMKVLFGYPPDQPMTVDDVNRGLLVDPGELDAARDRAIQAGEPGFEVEFPYRCPDGREVRWFLARIEIVRDAANKAQELVGLVVDITDRKHQEERQQLLLNELNHRVKNTLTIVMAVVDQTLRNTSSPEDFAAALQGRLQALSKAHNLLTDRVWRGRRCAISSPASWRSWPPRRIRSTSAART